LRTLLGNPHIHTLTKTSRAARNLTEKPIGHQLVGHGKWKPHQPNEPTPTPLPTCTWKPLVVVKP